MKRVFKYTISIDDEVRVEMPAGSKPLSVQVQGPDDLSSVHRLCLWALVDDDPAVATVERRLYIRGTGHPADEVEGCDYISTVQIAGGRLVFHVFDAGEVR